MTNIVPFDETPHSNKIIDDNVIEVEAVSEQTPQEKMEAELKKIPFIYRMSHALYDHWATHVVAFVGFAFLTEFGLSKLADHLKNNSNKKAIEVVEKEAANNNGFVKIHDGLQRLYNDTYVETDTAKTITLAEAKESILNPPKTEHSTASLIAGWAFVIGIGLVGGNYGRKGMNGLLELGDDAYCNRYSKIERKYAHDL